MPADLQPVLALDVDGVLLDPRGHGEGTWRDQLAARHGVDPAELSREFFARHWDAVVVGAEPIEPGLTEALERLGWRLTVEQVLQAWFEGDFTPDTEVIAAVNGWARRGIRIVVLTNQEHRRAAFLREHLAPMVPFDGMVYSAAIGVKKDDVAFFEQAAATLGLRPDEHRVVFVDDDPTNVATAREHSWVAVHFDHQPGWREEVEGALGLR